MKKIAGIILLSVAVLGAVGAVPSGQESNLRFVPLHVYLDAGDAELAVYQFELKAFAGDVKIVGVEGGEHEAFSAPPYYDPAAMAEDRIIIAAFDLGDDLPRGRTRVATLHVQITGEVEPAYEVDLQVAADSDGREIEATVSFE